jgi:hypothetical protein
LADDWAANWEHSQAGLWVDGSAEQTAGTLGRALVATSALAKADSPAGQRDNEGVARMAEWKADEWAATWGDEKAGWMAEK